MTKPTHDVYMINDCVSCLFCGRHINREHDMFTIIDDKGSACCGGCQNMKILHQHILDLDKRVAHMEYLFKCQGDM